MVGTCEEVWLAAFITEKPAITRVPARIESRVLQRLHGILYSAEYLHMFLLSEVKYVLSLHAGNDLRHAACYDQLPVEDGIDEQQID